jgi:hypothetical protein
MINIEHIKRAAGHADEERCRRGVHLRERKGGWWLGLGGCLRMRQRRWNCRSMNVSDVSFGAGSYGRLQQSMRLRWL